MTIGVLALQGAFIEHEQMLARLGENSFEIRQRRDLERSMDGLIIPGGESTVQGKLLRELGLFEELKARIQGGLPTFGACAGLLHFAVMDITAVRNAYGRQLGSFHTEADFAGVGAIPMTFIRAPYIASFSGAVQALAEVDGKVVAARESSLLVTAFHPELDGDPTVHTYFLDMIRTIK